MKVMGIDPSTSLTGVAVVRDGKLLSTHTWHKDAKLDYLINLVDYMKWLTTLMKRVKPDLVVVEQLAVFRNKDTVRKLMHAQAASSLVATQLGIPVKEVKAAEARRKALGKMMDKEDAFDYIRHTYPKHRFYPPKKGGMDETDAVVMALAGFDSDRKLRTLGR